MKVLLAALFASLVLVGPAAAETSYIVNAGYVSFEGFATSGDETPVLASNPKHRDLDSLFRGSMAPEAGQQIHQYLVHLVGGRPETKIIELGGTSLNRPDVNPDEVYLWLGTVGNTVALPEYFMFESDERHNQRLAVSFSYYLIHLKSHRIIFNQQALVVAPCRQELPLSTEYSKLILERTGQALANDRNDADRFSKALRNRSLGDVSNYIYSVSEEDVSAPEGFREILLPHFGSERTEESIRDLRRLIALEVSQGVGRKGVCLPALPRSLIDRVQVGDEENSGIWALFNLSALKDLDLPAGSFRNDARDGRVILSGQLPRPDFVLQAQTRYSEEFSAEYGGIRRVYRGHLEIDIDERLGDYIRRINGTKPITGSADARYAITGQPQVRGFCLSLKSALNFR